MIAAAPLEARTAPLLALVDLRGIEGQRFGHSALNWGAEVLKIPADPGRLWFEQVKPRLLETSPRVIGYSTLGSLFCLERLGWDEGLRVNLRIEHRPLSDNKWSHAYHGRIPSWSRFLLQGAVTDFGILAARVAFECRDGLADCTHAAPLHHPEQRGDAMVTWVLAPSYRQSSEDGA